MTTFTFIVKVVDYARGGTKGGNYTQKYNIDYYYYYYYVQQYLSAAMQFCVASV